MYTGTLIADLFEAVKRAEKAAAEPFLPREPIEEEILVGAEAHPSLNHNEALETE